jgi:TatD DNase family protein
MHITDSHNHLHFSEYRNDLSSVMDKALDAGVKTMLLVGIDPEDSLRALSTAETREGLFASVGIHPQNADTYSPADVLLLEHIASRQHAVAVGETGFDLYRTPDTENLQKELFIAHVELARKCSLPLVIHDRDAHRQTISVLDAEGAWSLGGVFHCYSGDKELAASILDKGFLLSVPGVLTYKNASVLRDVVRMCPLDSLLVETDAPYLAPVPYRGRRNEPSYLKETLRELAEIKGCTVEQAAEKTTENFFRLFPKTKKRE